MRIIGGKYRSLTLAPVKAEGIRPTADRVKESLFNILGSKVRSARVLDLFCGSGALGLECISRGAREAVFNDLSRQSIELLKKNIARLKGENCYKIYNLGFEDCLSAQTGKFDIIFVDPPYKSEAGIAALESIARLGLLNADGTAVFERDRPFTGAVDGLRLYDERKYGITYIGFFEVTQ